MFTSYGCVKSIELLNTYSPEVETALLLSVSFKASNEASYTVLVFDP